MDVNLSSAPPLHPIPILLMLGAAAIAALASLYQVFAFRRAVARWSGLALLGIALNLSAYVCLRLNLFPAAGKVLAIAQVAGYLLLDIGFLVFSMHFSGRSKWVNQRSLAILCFPPALVMALLLVRWEALPATTFAVNSGFGVNTTPFNGPVGAAEALFIIYSNLVGGISLALLASMLKHAAPFFRTTILGLVAGVVMISATGLAEILGANPIPSFSLLQLTIAISTIPTTLIVYNSNSLDATPINLQLLKDTMRDGYIVLDRQERLVDFNLAMSSLLGGAERLRTGLSLDEILPGLDASAVEAVEAALRGEKTTARALFETRDCAYEVSIHPVEAENQEPVGVMLTFHNVSDQERMELALIERSRAIAQTNTILQGLAEANLQILASNDLASIFGSLGSQLSRIGLECFIACLDPLNDELRLVYISPQQEVIHRFEKAAGLKVQNFHLSRKVVPELYSYLDRDDGDHFHTTFQGGPDGPESPARWKFEPALRLIGIDPQTRMLIFRLMAGEKKMGLMGIWGKTLDSDLLSPLRIFAGQVAWAIERVNLSNTQIERSTELERSNRLISALANVSAQMGRSTASSAALETLGQELEQLGLHCVLGSVDPAGEVVTFRYASFMEKIHRLRKHLPGFEFIGYELPQKLWPGRAVIGEGIPVWYENIVGIFNRMFPVVPDAVFKQAMKGIGITASDSLCILPLLVDGRVTGVLAIWGKEIQKRDTPALMVFAHQVAEFLRKTQSFEQEAIRANSLARTNAMIMALSNVAASLETSASMPEVYETLGRELKKVQINCMVGTLDEQKQNLKIEYLSISAEIKALARKLGNHWPDEIRVPRHLWPTDKAVTERTPYWDPDPLGNTSRMFPFIPRAVFLKAFETVGMNPSDQVCYLPMISEEEVIGILAVWGSYLDQADLPGLNVFANQVATAIRNTTLYNQAQEELRSRTQAEARIKVALEEKEIMLKEIHHRVKNNLQIISSLLNLQIGQAGAAASVDGLRESQNRVRAMALIHEKLYQSNDLAQINFSSYLQSLTNSLAQTYRRPQEQVAIQVKTDSILLDLDTAIPCGLIVNELVSNSLKYAFPNGQTGNIAIGCHAAEEGCYRLVVADDGVGLPPGLDPAKSNSLGLKLVTSLVRQINGQLEVSSPGGARFEVTFPGAKEAARELPARQAA